jgi:2-polyprenyl-3-methyl-5-hydroxy-6-metoxy-1,4-benzoquinol methylase
LRFTIPLALQVKKVVALDSPQQIEREQKIDGCRTTTRGYAKKYLSNVRVCSTDEKWWKCRKFDFVLCSNVLSCVPRYTERKKILRNIGKALKRNGHCLVFNQHRNTYFRRYEKQSNARKHIDGWLIDLERRFSFYGIISPKRLRAMCVAEGFKVLRNGVVGESAYCLIASSKAKKAQLRAIPTRR